MHARGATMNFALMVIVSHVCMHPLIADKEEEGGKRRKTKDGLSRLGQMETVRNQVTMAGGCRSVAVNFTGYSPNTVPDHRFACECSLLLLLPACIPISVPLITHPPRRRTCCGSTPQPPYSIPSSTERAPLHTPPGNPYTYPTHCFTTLNFRTPVIPAHMYVHLSS